MEPAAEVIGYVRLAMCPACEFDLNHPAYILDVNAVHERPGMVVVSYIYNPGGPKVRHRLVCLKQGEAPKRLARYIATCTWGDLVVFYFEEPYVS